MVRAILFTGLMALTSAAAVAQELTPDQLRRADQHYRAGLELMTAERWERAAEEFRAAIAIDKLMAWAHYQLGQSLMAQQRYVQASLAYVNSRDAFETIALRVETLRGEREVARQDEMNEINDSLKRQVYTNSLTRARMEDRLRTLDWAANRDLIAQVPVPAEVYLALGSSYFRQNKYDAAEREYREAVRVRDGFGAAHNNLAVLLMLTGRLNEAQASLARAEASGFRVNPQFKADLQQARLRAR